MYILRNIVINLIAQYRIKRKGKSSFEYTIHFIFLKNYIFVAIATKYQNPG